ncbi:unnamed protein product [Camellia sinensis]
MSVEGEIGSHGRSVEETDHLNRSTKKTKGSGEIDGDNMGENTVDHEAINIDCAKGSNTADDAMVDTPDESNATITEANCVTGLSLTQQGGALKVNAVDSNSRSFKQALLRSRFIENPNEKNFEILKKDSANFPSDKEDRSEEEAEEEIMEESEDLQCQIPRIWVPVRLLKKARKPWGKCLI